ncbi:MAG: hypothetical protein LBU32_06760 [Clostridiales bacterium]|jgi:hypothetical protein|nr:hypothetical protein [Clostridiales bacterium]
MGKIISGHGGDGAYYFRNFMHACKLCNISEENKDKILKYFLYKHIPPDNALLKHFSECGAFYSHIFINHFAYSRKNDVALLIYQVLNERGMRFIIDPILPNLMRFDAFTEKVANPNEIDVKKQSTSKVELKDMVKIIDYGLKYNCGEHMYYIVQYAKAVKYDYTYKSSYSDLLGDLKTEKTG